MDLKNIPGYDEALRVIERAQSLRMRQLTLLERYVEGTQYAGRPDWFSTDKPLWERAPCVVYPIARAAIDSNTDLILGEGRFPSICVPHQDDQLEDAGLAQDDAELLNRWLVEMEHYVRLRAVTRELFASAQGCGSACAIVAIRNGRPVVDTTRASWCTPTLDADGAVTKLVIEYPFIHQMRADDGTWMAEARLYRREIDAQTDITYKPAKLAEGLTPEWTADVVVKHQLGFCPVVWYVHSKGCSTVADIDGHAIHEHLLDEITALDFALSQRHRAALYAGDPQWTEIGVEPGWNPTSAGRMPMSMPATQQGGVPGPSNPITSRYMAAPTGAVRKKSPGDIWQYENPDAKVTLHTLPGDALDALDKHARDLKVKLGESLGVVFLDPEYLPKGTNLSGRALNTLRSRQLDRCDSYRSDFGDLCLRPLVAMLMKLVSTRPAGLRIPGIAKVRGIISQVLERGLMLLLDWGPYSRPEPAEELALMQAAIAAKDGGLATLRSAVMMAKDVLGVEDVDEHLEQLAEEKAKRVAEAQDAMKKAALTPGAPPFASAGAAPAAPEKRKPEGKDDKPPVAQATA